jgi:type I restriction-modification system DNA methylase subunit
MSPTSGHLSENTWNARLASTLRTRGFPTADFEIILPTLRGIRKPDVPFQGPDGLCFVSAKIGTNKEVDAVASAYEYLQSIGEVCTVSEAFALTYPSANEKDFHLRVLANNKHMTLSWTFSDFVQVVEKISAVVTKDWETAQIGKESTITSAIRVLRNGVIGLSSAFTKTSPEEFEALFGGKAFFENVLGYEKIKKNQENDLKSAAAYLFINQILFYEILSREAGFAPIVKEDLTRPTVLKPKYFDQVLKIDYRPIFNFDIASKISGREAGDSCKQIILAIRTLFPERIDHDIIGKVFHNVIPLEIRKVVAAYFTNNAAGDLLARLAVKSKDDKVLDPACGSGTLLVSAYKRKLELSHSKITKEIHGKFVEHELTGIDIMPFSAHLAAVNLALLGLPNNTDNLRIAIADSTKHKIGDKILPAREVLKEAFKSSRITDYFTDTPTVTVSTTKMGALALQEKEAEPIVLESVDVIIMNPPFTSSDNLRGEYKNELRRRFAIPSAYAKCLTGKLSFQAYFVLLADKFLKKDGRLACVLPFSTFVGKAFHKLDEFLVRNYTIECIIFGLGRSAFSDNTNFSEVLFVARKAKPIENRFVVTATKTPPTEWTDENVVSIKEQIEESQKITKIKETKLALSISFNQSDLISKKSGLNQLTLQFDRHFSETLSFLHNSYSNSGKVRQFHNVAKSAKFDLFAYELRIKGGMYYGFSALSISASENRMKKKTDLLLYLEQNERNIKAKNRFTDEIYTYPKAAVVGQVRRISDIDHMNISNDNEFVVSRYFDDLPSILKAIYSEEKKKEFEYKIRREWRKKVEHGISNFVFARRIDLTARGTKLLSLFSEKPRFLSANSWGIRNLSSEDAKILCLWFNSTLFLTEILSKRTQTRGSWGQMDEHYVFEMNCIDPLRLSDKQRMMLLELFDMIGDKAFPSLMEQLKDGFELRRKLDSAFLTILEVNKENQKQFLENFYETMYKHLSAMRETMKGD